MEPGPWIEVDAEAARSVEGQTIYHQGPEAPVLTQRAVARLPEAALADVSVPLAIVQVVVSTDGRVARMRVMRAPDVPGLTEALVEALGRWRFEPARVSDRMVDRAGGRVGGEPVAVYFMVTVPLRADARPPGS